MKKFVVFLMTLFFLVPVLRVDALQETDLKLRQRVLQKKMRKLSKRANKQIKVKDELQKKMIELMQECFEYKKNEFLKNENLKELSTKQLDEIKKDVLDEIDKLANLFEDGDSQSNGKIKMKEISDNLMKSGLEGCVSWLQLTFIQICINQKVIEKTLSKLQACMTEFFKTEKIISEASQI